MIINVDYLGFVISGLFLLWLMEIRLALKASIAPFLSSVYESEKWSIH